MEKISVAEARRAEAIGREGRSARLGAHAARLQGRLQLPRAKRRLVPRQRPGDRRGHAAELPKRGPETLRRLQRHRRRRWCAPRRPRDSRRRCWRRKSRSTAGPTRRRIRCRKKATSLEFLRENAHLRPRSNTFGAVARVRNQVCLSIHQFFQEQGFLYIHTPIITASDCEGAGQMFRVTTIDPAKPPRYRPKGRGSRLQAGLLRPAGLPDGERPAGGGDFRLRPGQGLHFRPNVPGGELEHVASSGRVLDDRAGDGVFRSDRQHGPRRGVPQAHLPRRAGTLPPRTCSSSRSASIPR